MKAPRPTLAALAGLVGLALLLAACSSTVLRDTWKDPRFRGEPLRNVLVIGVDQYDVLTIESTLWDMRQERAVWSGTSESTEPKDVATLTGELAKLLIARMKDDKVL